jgi:hypothetical protein
MDVIKEPDSHFKMTEFQLQCAVKRYADYNQLPFIHVANEGARSKWEGYNLKKAGMMPGVADCFFMRGNDTHKGLWIELKVPPNRPTPNQISFLSLANSEGYHAVVCYSIESAIAEIRDFYQL